MGDISVVGGGALCITYDTSLRRIEQPIIPRQLFPQPCR